MSRPALPIIAFAIRTALLTVGAAGCNPSDQTLRADLTAYLQRAADWAPVEAETARTIDRILATQFVDEPEVRRQVASDSPRAEAHLARVETVRPASPELRLIHEHYVETWRGLVDGYRTLLRGLDTGHVPDIASSRAALEAWRTGILDTAADLRRLRARLGD